MTELTNSRSDRVKVARSLSGRSSRSRNKQFLVEGPQSIRELVRFTPEQVRDLYVTEAAAERYSEIIDAANDADLYVHTCSDEVLRAMSEDAQGLLAVARMPQLEFADVDLSGIKNVAVLCQVRDPGNVGTIIRAADAAGADLVVLTSGSVDIFNPKVVRSTAGSLFHLPVVTDVDIDELARAFNAAHIQIFAAAGNADFDVDDLLDQVGAPSTQNADATDAGHVSSDGTPQAPDMTHPTAWLFGNEAQGLSEQEFAAADYTVSVPIRGAAESLNVATAATVCLYATSRAQR